MDTSHLTPEERSAPAERERAIDEHRRLAHEIWLKGARYGPGLDPAVSDEEFRIWRTAPFEAEHEPRQADEPPHRSPAPAQRELMLRAA